MTRRVCAHLLIAQNDLSSDAPVTLQIRFHVMAKVCKDVDAEQTYTSVCCVQGRLYADVLHYITTILNLLRLHRLNLINATQHRGVHSTSAERTRCSTRSTV